MFWKRQFNCKKLFLRAREVLVGGLGTESTGSLWSQGDKCRILQNKQIKWAPATTTGAINNFAERLYQNALRRERLLAVL
jgi:hypothetical protein